MVVPVLTCSVVISILVVKSLINLVVLVNKIVEELTVDAAEVMGVCFEVEGSTDKVVEVGSDDTVVPFCVLSILLIVVFSP